MLLRVSANNAYLLFLTFFLIYISLIAMLLFVKTIFYVNNTKEKHSNNPVHS